MYFKSLFILACITVISLPSMAKELSLTKQLEFNNVTQEKNIVGVVAGFNSKRYQIKVKANQILDVNMESNDVYFNIYSPYKNRDDDALFVGKSQGQHFKSALSKEGLYMIRVYLKKDEAKEDIKRIFEMHIKLI
jgi:hypothetical protein